MYELDQTRTHHEVACSQVPADLVLRGQSQ